MLAGGRGTRLGSLGRRVPKVLLDLAGRPLLAWHLDRFERDGLERVVVSAHHLADSIQEFADDYRGPLELRVVVEPVLVGTAGGVRYALGELGTGPFLVLYGDVVTTEPLHGLLEAHARGGAVATVAVHRAPAAEGKGIVEVDADGRVRRFVEKGPPGAGPALINSGIYVLEPELVEPLPVGVPLDFGFDVFPQALADRTRIVAHELERPVIDVGTPEGLAAARAFVGGASGTLP